MSEDQTPAASTEPKPGEPGVPVSVEMYGGPQDGNVFALPAGEDGRPPRYYSIQVPVYAEGPDTRPGDVTGTRPVRCELIVRRTKDKVGRFRQSWCYEWPAGA